MLLSEIFLSTLSLRRATRKGSRRCVLSSISIHALLAESDVGHLLRAGVGWISIHALLAESDCWAQSRRQPSSNFYPRSPCGERRERKSSGAAVFTISIHAPLAESDDTAIRVFRKTRISIHALLAESDLFSGDHGHIKGDISIHALLAESDAYAAQFAYNSIISIHALLAESDAYRVQLGSMVWISIHALLAESDTAFQKLMAALLQFLSTLSLRRATFSDLVIASDIIHFYPRSPCGERRNESCEHTNNGNFYPRSPCGERLAYPDMIICTNVISIHALLAESDRHGFAMR